MDLLILFLQIFGVIASLLAAWFFFSESTWPFAARLFREDIRNPKVGLLGLFVSGAFMSLAVWQTVEYGWITL